MNAIAGEPDSCDVLLHICSAVVGSSSIATLVALGIVELEKLGILRIYGLREKHDAIEADEGNQSDCEDAVSKEAPLGYCGFRVDFVFVSLNMRLLLFSF